jgi:hypothetical protein
MGDKKETPPPGVEAMMMSMKMMDTYGLKTGPGLKDVVPSKLFDKEFAMKEIIDLGFYSAFHPHRKSLEVRVDCVCMVASASHATGLACVV